YATLGSSGRRDKMRELMKSFSRLPFRVMMATAGNDVLETSCNIYRQKYLPGKIMAKKALAVISNGGSTTGYQALLEGKPVVGISSNLDQYLCMENLVEL